MSECEIFKNNHGRPKTVREGQDKAMSHQGTGTAPGQECEPEAGQAEGSESGRGMPGVGATARDPFDAHSQDGCLPSTRLLQGSPVRL